MIKKEQGLKIHGLYFTLGTQTLEIHRFELVLKTLEIHVKSAYLDFEHLCGFCADFLWGFYHLMMHGFRDMYTVFSRNQKRRNSRLYCKHNFWTNLENSDHSDCSGYWGKWVSMYTSLVAEGSLIAALKATTYLSNSNDRIKLS